MFLCGQCHLKYEQQSTHSVVELLQLVYWMVPTSVHKYERKEKFGWTGIFGSRIFCKHLQWCVDEAEWKRKTFPNEEKSIRHWKDIIFMLLFFFFFFFLSTVSASVTQNVMSSKQRSENWFYLNNPAKPCRYIFHFHYFFSPRLPFSSYPSLAMLFLVMSLIFAWNVTLQPMCTTATLKTLFDCA